MQEGESLFIPCVEDGNESLTGRKRTNYSYHAHPFITQPSKGKISHAAYSVDN